MVIIKLLLWLGALMRSPSLEDPMGWRSTGEEGKSGRVLVLSEGLDGCMRCHLAWHGCALGINRLAYIYTFKYLVLGD